MRNYESSRRYVFVVKVGKYRNLTFAERGKIMKIDKVNSTSIRIEDNSVRAINTNYRTEGKEKQVISDENRIKKPDAVEERKKQAQKDAMKIAHDTWEEGRIIEHEAKKETSVKRESVQNIKVSFENEQKKTQDVSDAPKNSSSVVSEIEKQQAKTITATEKQQIKLDVESEKPQIAKKIKNEVSLSILKRENVKNEFGIEESEQQPKWDTTSGKSLMQLDVVLRGPQMVPTEDETSEDVSVSEDERKNPQLEAMLEETKKQEDTDTSKKSYFERMVDEQQKDNAKRAEYKKEILKEQAQKAAELKETQQKELAKEEMAKEIRQEELEKIEEKTQEEREMRKEELMEEMMEDMSKTLKGLAVMDGIQNGVYDKVEDLLDKRILLKDDVKGIIIDENI